MNKDVVKVFLLFSSFIVFNYGSCIVFILCFVRLLSNDEFGIFVVLFVFCEIFLLLVSMGFVLLLMCISYLFYKV